MKLATLFSIVTCFLTLVSNADDRIDLTFKDGNGKGTYPSSAVLVDTEGLLATVAIVGVDPTSASYITNEGKHHQLEVVAHDDVSRLTLLRLPNKLMNNLDVQTLIGNSSFLRPADALFTSITEGAELNRLVSHDKRYEGQVLPLMLCRVHYASAVPTPGTPIYNQEKHLVALAHQSIKGSKNAAYALPIQSLKRLIAAEGDLSKISRCWVGIGMDPSNDALTVTSVRPGSPGADGGVKRGDVLLSIDGNQLGDYAEVVNAFYYLVPDERVEFKVLRGTEIITMKVTPVVNPVFSP